MDLGFGKASAVKNERTLAAASVFRTLSFL